MQLCFDSKDFLVRMKFVQARYPRFIIVIIDVEKGRMRSKQKLG